MILSGQYDDNNICSIRTYVIHRDMMYITYMGRESAAKTLRAKPMSNVQRLSRQGVGSKCDRSGVYLN